MRKNLKFIHDFVLGYVYIVSVLLSFLLSEHGTRSSPRYQRAITETILKTYNYSQRIVSWKTKYNTRMSFDVHAASRPCCHEQHTTYRERICRQIFVSLLTVGTGLSEACVIIMTHRVLCSDNYTCKFLFNCRHGALGTDLSEGCFTANSLF